MYLESIAIKHGVIRHATYHQQRMKRTAGVKIDLDTLLRKTCPDIDNSVYYKFRIEYDAQKIISASITPYSMREVYQLVVMEVVGELDYHLKYVDREVLNRYEKGLPLGRVPLLTRGGWVTDTTYTNVCFCDQEGRWLTPSTPLLKGVMRESLLESGQISEADIHVERLREFRSVALINAMIPLGELVLPISCINF